MHNQDTLCSYKIFSSFNNLLAFTTTKKSIDNSAPRFTGDERAKYMESRRKLAVLLDINAKQLLFPGQTHTICVATISAFPKWELKDTDALVTNKTGICLCVQTADCVPLLLFDPVRNVIAAVHAGWRGTVKKIAAAAINNMVLHYQCMPQNILASIGPSIGPEVYEIGDEVISSVEKYSPSLKNTLIKKSSGKTFFNLWEANRVILLETGLLQKNIEVSGECTFAKNDNYFSARKEGINTGRIVTGIMLK